MAPHTTFGENPISAARCHTRTREIARASGKPGRVSEPWNKGH